MTQAQGGSTILDQPFQLGEFDVNPKALRIEKSERSVKVEFKVMQVLLVLADNAGDVVSRRTLESTVWSGRVVTEDAVTNAVAKLRRAFEDNARSPSYIETVPKLGYRLLQTPQPPERDETLPDLPGSRKRLYLAVSAAAVVIVAVFVGLSNLDDQIQPNSADRISLEPAPAVSPIEAQGVSDGFGQSDAGNTLAAYDEFSKGLTAYLRMTPADIEVARGHYLAAIELDPSFARAYAGAGMTYIRGVMDGWASDPEQSIGEAVRYVTMAERIASDVPQIYFVKGLIALFRGQHLAAAEAAHTATQIDPNYADAYGLLAWVLHLGGRADVATEALHEAVRLKPESSASFEVIAGEINFAKGQYDEAVACFNNALERNPTHPRARLWLAASLVQTGELDDARWELEELLAQNPDFSFENAAFGMPQKDPELLSRFFRALGQVRRVN